MERDIRSGAGKLGGFSGVVLCGGRSSRMGQDKAGLLWNGKTLLECQVEKLRRLGIEDILLSGPAVPLPGTRAVPDIYPARGPLGGIYACLLAARELRCIVITVDMPRLPAETLRDLAARHMQIRPDITMLTAQGRDQPLVAVYEAVLAPRIEALIRSGGAAVRSLVDAAAAERVEYRGAEEGLLNCNTPEDYRRLCRLSDPPGDIMSPSKAD